MLKIKSESVVKAVDVIGMVPSRAGIPSSEFMRLRSAGGKLYFALSADLFGEVHVKSFGKDKWEAFVDRASFIPFVNASRDSGSKAAFVFRYDDGVLTVKCGRRKGVFNKLSVASAYSSVEAVSGKRVILSTAQRKAISLAAKYATPDPTVAHLNCVYVERTGDVLASNERGAVRIKTKPVGAAMPIPLGVLTTLDHEGVQELILGKKLATIGFDIGFLCQNVNQKAAAQFPTKAIHASFEGSENYPRRFKVDSIKFVDAMVRLYDCSSVVVKRDAVVRVIGVKGESLLRFVCKVPQGQFVETVPVVAELKTDIKAEWLVESLVPLSALRKKAGTFSVRYEDSGRTPYLITCKGLELLISRRMARAK